MHTRSPAFALNFFFFFFFFLQDLVAHLRSIGMVEDRVAYLQQARP
jgi:hypothetical protein